MFHMVYNKPLRAWISGDTHKKMEKEAKKRGLTISELTRLILDGYFEHRKTDAILEELLTIIKEDAEIQAAIKKKIKKK